MEFMTSRKSKKIYEEIKKNLKENAPQLTQDQKSRMYKILNSSDPNFVGYGLKLSDIEKIVRIIFNNNKCNHDNAIQIFKRLIASNIHDEKFAGIFFLNRIKSEFNEQTIDLFHDELSKHCDTWALLDSTCIRVIGPFLEKHEKLAEKTIEMWSNDKNLWIRRASMVILLKIISIRKAFDEKYLFKLVEKNLKYPEDYIQKGMGWLLKTASKFKPDVIFNYLEKNKAILPRLVLRYGSEKLPKEKRAQILKKE